MRPLKDSGTSGTYDTVDGSRVGAWLSFLKYVVSHLLTGYPSYLVTRLTREERRNLPTGLFVNRYT